MRTPTTILALASGALGATGGVMGKIALGSDNSAFSILTQFLCFEFLMGRDTCEVYIPIVCRLHVFGLMLYVNVLMISMFLKALSRTDHSLKVVVLNTAANFITTGVLGQLIFNEVMTVKWSVGALIIVLGMCLITISGANATVGTKVRAKNSDHLNRGGVYDHLTGIARDTFRN